MNERDKPEPMMIDGPPTVTYKDRWAERLWACMAWSIFLFNLVMAINFAWEIWGEQHYNYHKHIITAVTMCASYIALIWTHRNILRDE